MKGIFFCEFLEMVEDTFSPALADAIIADSALAADGAYTAGGLYDYRELLRLVDGLSARTGIGDEELMVRFGNHLFPVLADRYPEFFKGGATAFQFLGAIEDHIHAEVLKIYPDSEMATFETRQSDPATLLMTYSSRRPFGALALGLMQGCCRYFGEDVEIEQEDLSAGGVTRLRFTLQRRDPLD